MVDMVHGNRVSVDDFRLYSHLETITQNATNGRGANGTSLRFSPEQIDAALLAQGIGQADFPRARENAVQRGLLLDFGDSYGLPSQGLVIYRAVCRRI